MEPWLSDLVSRLYGAGYPEPLIEFICGEVIRARAEERSRLATWIRETGMSVHISYRDRFLVVYHRGSDDAHGYVTDPDLHAALSEVYRSYGR